MQKLETTENKARQGVGAATNQFTKIQVRTASIELLVGGPYLEHPYGHTALRVTTAEGDRIFDYGRYARTWGVGSSEGEGILNIWNDFNVYIREENSLGRTTTGFVYETTEENAKTILKFYYQKIAGKKPRAKTKVKETFVIEDYYALGPNCTTLSVAAAKTVFPDIDRDWKKYREGRGLGIMQKGLVSAKGWPDYIFMPADLLEMLKSPTAKKPKLVKTYNSKS